MLKYCTVEAVDLKPSRLHILKQILGKGGKFCKVEKTFLKNQLFERENFAQFSF